MCGIVGLCNVKKQLGQEITMGLHPIQHRGQDANGGVSSNGFAFYPRSNPIKKLGLVNVNSPIELPGHMAIGHLRYSTQGDNNLLNAQPHCAPGLRLASNGDITNQIELRKRLAVNKIPVKSRNDAEILVKIIYLNYRETGNIIKAIQKTMLEVCGAFSAVLMTNDKLYAFRDLYGFRPLEMGVRSDEAVMFASETVALDARGFQFVKELAAGEIVEVSKKGVEFFPFIGNDFPLSQCHFELVYFSHPDSMVFGIPVKLFRNILGGYLARYSLEQSSQVIQGNSMYNNCVVTPIPDSSNSIALGFARYRNCQLPFDLLITRSHYVGRTFIQPGIYRDLDVDLKFTFNPYLYQGITAIVIDDTIVRGNTIRKIVAKLKDICKVAEVHIRIGNPPIKFPCHFGIDIHKNKELIAALMGVPEICNFIGTKTLLYNTLDNLQATIRECGGNPDHFCYACLTGRYPCPIDDYQVAA